MWDIRGGRGSAAFQSHKEVWLSYFLYTSLLQIGSAHETTGK